MLAIILPLIFVVGLHLLRLQFPCEFPLSGNHFLERMVSFQLIRLPCFSILGVIRAVFGIWCGLIAHNLDWSWCEIRKIIGTPPHMVWTHPLIAQGMGIFNYFLHTWLYLYLFPEKFDPPPVACILYPLPYLVVQESGIRVQDTGYGKGLRVGVVPYL